jgi:photosystem II stability/assembly factor-like uncharacterized protein
MKTRRIAIIALTIVLIVAVLTGAVSALNATAKPVVRAELANVRDYTPAVVANGASYAVDGGALFAGQPTQWVHVQTPETVIVSAVAVDSKNPDTLYIGAANEMAIYRSTDGGDSWQRIPLTEKAIGGVTDVALDSAQRLVYVGTDTAGVFRLRDVGGSVILGGQLLLEEPVVQVAADSTGKGLAFARTEWNLYRAENFGLTWVTVEDLKSVPTALAIANTNPAKVYVGTLDRGLLVSEDGLSWIPANTGLGMVPGSRLQVTDLAVDPLQPEVVYAATSFLYGTSEVHATPGKVALSVDAAQEWTTLVDKTDVAVADLMPVPGMTGAVYALTDQSRTPLALGNAPVASEVVVVPTAEGGLNLTGLLAWIVAALAAVALIYAVAMDLRSRRIEPVTRLSTSPVRSNQ